MNRSIWLTFAIGVSSFVTACGVVGNSSTNVGGGVGGGSQTDTTHFSVTTPVSATARTQVSFTVTALDASNNVVTSYSGTVHFTSTDAQALLPGNSTLVNGTGTFSAELDAGSWTISATAAATASITGTSSMISVTAPAQLAITPGNPPSGTAGDVYNPERSRYVKCVPGSPGCICRYDLCLRRVVTPSFTFMATGGVSPYSWTWAPATNSSLPPGLILDKAVISGTPTSPGSYNVVVTVTDSGSPAAQMSANYTIAIALPPPPAINAVTLLPIGTLGSPYVGFTFTTSAGTGALTWSEAGALPQGMTLSMEGALSGTPTVAGSFPITVMARDSFGQSSTPVPVTLQVLTQGFSPTGSMATERVLHTATLLGDGTVLVAGGVNNTDFPTMAELYDPTTAKFAQTKGSLTMIRVSPIATLLKSGKVLLVGGKSGPGVELATAEVFDPATGTFAATSGNMSDGRTYGTATLLKDGTVLVTGGLDPAGDGPGTPIATAEIYDPAADSFTLTGSMTTARFFQTATLLENGMVLITGGLNSGQPLATAEIYDPVAKTFSSTGTMTMARMGHTATLLSSGKVLLAGGAGSFGGDSLAAAELYDPSSGSFTATNPMISARSTHTATLLQNGQVLVAGGAGVFYGRGQSTSLSSAELFDPTTGNFTATADMTAVREQHTATLLNTGEVLVVGGSNGTIGYSTTTTVLATAELYQ
jgi:hypothetical protein